MFSTILTALLVLAGATAVSAGQSTVTCMPTTAWLNSDAGDSPCAIWAQMRNICDASSSSDVLPLATLGTIEYAPPTAASSTVDCDCNEEAYNLAAACAYCQPGGYTWPTLAEWSASCPAYTSNFDESAGYERDPSTADSLLLVLPFSADFYHPTLTWVPSEACDESLQSSECVAQFPLSSTGGASTTSDGFGYSGSGYSGPFSGDDGSQVIVPPIANLAALTAIAVVILVLPALCSIAALIVCCLRQRNRKKFYQPLAAYYANGGVYVDSTTAVPYYEQQPSNRF